MIRAKATGGELVRAIRRRAYERGMTVSAFAAELSPNVMTWLRQTENAAAPKPHTIERVKALLEGRPVPPAPANNFQKSPRSAPTMRPEPGPALDNCPPRVDRDPCTWCGTRADVGCSHQRRVA